jgi:flagellar hook assembly protein FlgD
LIKTLTTNKQSAGQGIVQWNGPNDTGISLPSGVYFYQFSSADFTATRKIVLLK